MVGLCCVMSAKGHRMQQTDRMTNGSAWGAKAVRFPVGDVVVLGLILGLALLFRLPYATLVGHVDLTRDIIPWMIRTNESGVFAAYAANPTLNYPPVFLSLMTGLVAIWTQAGLPLDLQSGAPIIGLFKSVTILADLGLIVVVYTEFRNRRWLRVLLPLFLAIHPALIAVSAFWGQIEPIWTMGVVLAALSFRRDRPLAGWVCLAVAILSKIQPVVALPVFVVLTYRRYGLRRLALCLGVFALVVGAVLAPFVIVSGFQSTMRPYLNAIDMFPHTTLNAYNAWYLLNPASWSRHYPLNVPNQPDSLLVLGPLTARSAGLIMLALWTLVVMVNTWRKYRAPNEYVWLTAIYFGFFMLPTQIHERYLYPVLITSVLAIANDARMWGVVLPLVWSYTYNIVAFTHAPFNYLGFNYLFRMGDIGLQAAVVQTLTFFVSAVVMLSKVNSRRAKLILIPLWTLIALIIGITTMDRLIPDSLPEAVHSADALLDGTTRLSGYDIQPNESGMDVVLYWHAEQHNNEDYAIFVHVLRDGERVAQVDMRPMNGEYPVWRWFADQVVETRFNLAFDPSEGFPDTLQVGLYDQESMRRASVIQNGVMNADQFVTLDLTGLTP